MTTERTRLRADMHVHSYHSGYASHLRFLRTRDCYSDPEDVYRVAKARGMDLVTITDHDSINGCLEFLDKHPDAPDFFISEEIECWMPGLPLKVHLGVYGLNERIHREVQPLRRDVFEAAEYLRQQNVCVSLNHLFFFYRDQLPVGEYVTAMLRTFGMFEVRNGAMLREQNQLIEDLVSRARGSDAAVPSSRITPVGGSDAHTLRRIGTTYTEAEGRTREEFLANLARGAPAFPAEVIRKYVEQDRILIQAIQPDLVIGDMRLSLPISAGLERVLCAVMMNAYWSPYAKRHSILPTMPITRRIPPKMLAPFYRIAEPIASAVHVAEMNKVRKELGVPRLPPDLRALYTEGDFVLYPDIPEFIPTYKLPSHHGYVGTCQPQCAVARPDWWQRAVDDPRPKVFVTLGNSGPLETLPSVLEALARLPVAVILSTSGRKVAAVPPDAYVAQLLPYEDTARLARAVITNGGSGGVYRAIAAGTPVLGIPSTADMHLSTAFLVESAAGLGVRVEEATPSRLRRAIEALVFDGQYHVAARAWAILFARYDSRRMFGEFLDEVLPAR